MGIEKLTDHFRVHTDMVRLKSGKRIGTSDLVVRNHILRKAPMEKTAKIWAKASVLEDLFGNLIYKNVYSLFRKHSETALYLFELINRGERI